MRFPGTGFFLTRLKGEEAAGQGYTVSGLGDITASLPELLEPRDRLTIFITAGRFRWGWNDIGPDCV